jgi:hypothetical protein
MSCRFVFICTVIKWEMKDKKAKNKVGPNGKRTYEPQKEEMVVNVQQGSSKQIEEMGMTRRQNQTRAKWGVKHRDDMGCPVVPGRAIFKY